MRVVIVAVAILGMRDTGRGKEPELLDGACLAEPAPRASLTVQKVTGTATVTEATPRPESDYLATGPISGGFECLRRAEEGEVTITAEEAGCFSHETESVALRWSRQSADLRVNFADLLETGIDPMAVRSPDLALEIVGRILDTLEVPDKSDGVCTTQYMATLTWACGPFAGGQDFEEADCGGPGLEHRSPSERLFYLARELVAGRDLTGIEWPPY